MMDIAVIIPFYQANSGILTRALDCIFRQIYRDVVVIIVDDESPLPPAAEVQGRPECERARIRIISRKNGGCYSAARPVRRAAL